jgi:hypothetical protein
MGKYVKGEQMEVVIGYMDEVHKRCANLTENDRLFLF